VGCDPL